MAFENVFGNVDFRMPVQAAQQKQATFLDAIGRGMQFAQQKEAMDLRRRQLDMRANQAPDVKAQAQQYMIDELVRRNPGMTPQEAAAQVYSASKQAVNPYTGQSTPNMMGALGIGSAMPTMGEMTGGGPDNMPGMSLPLNAPPTQNYMTPEQEAQRTEAMARNSDFSNIDPLAARPQYSGDTPGAKKSATEASIANDAYLSRKMGEKKIESHFKGIELNEAQALKQQAFENKLVEYASEFGDLIDVGNYKKTLPDDFKLGDVVKNLSASAQSSGAGKAIGGAIGTPTAAALKKMSSTHPLIFGELRELLGMTGKELDTPAEAAYYKGVVPGGDTDVDTVLDTLDELSVRFGTGAASETINKIKVKLNVRKKIGDMSADELIFRRKQLEKKRNK